MSETMTSAVSARGRAGGEGRGAIRFGWAVVIGVFGTLMVWSIAAPFEGAVLTAGQVAVETNQQAVQHLEGGIVQEIYVSEADTVRAGQKLITLDATTADASLQALEARLSGLLGTEARLLAERDEINDIEIRAGFEDMILDERMQSVLATQRSLLVARRNTFSTQLQILRQRVAQFETRIDGMTREIAAKDEQIDLLADEVTRFEILTRKGNASEVRVLALKRDLSRLKGEKEALRSEIAATRVQIGEAQSELIRMRQDRQESILSELRETQTQIEELSEQRAAALDRRRRLDILAPRSGTVLGIKAHTIGGVISSSEPVMYIVPEDDRLVAKVRVSPADIDKISIGQKAALRFPAFNQDRTPQYDGEVVQVSADVLSDPASGALFYEAVLSIPDEALASKAFHLVPGMPVDASLKTESRNVLSYLVKPLADSIAETFRE